MGRQGLSLYHQHVEKWKNGCGSSLCPEKGTSSQVCLVRGHLPCDVLFVGEAPGRSESCIGLPFVGPAGHLIDSIIERALSPGVTHALTNLVGCLPLEDDGRKATAPPEEAIEKCSARLQDIVRIANPDLLVCVGSLSKDWLTPGHKWTIKFHKPMWQLDIIHPAAILRSNTAQQGLLIQRATVQLRIAVRELFGEERVKSTNEG